MLTQDLADRSARAGAQLVEDQRGRLSSGPAIHPNALSGVRKSDLRRRIVRRTRVHDVGHVRLFPLRSMCIVSRAAHKSSLESPTLTGFQDDEHRKRFEAGRARAAFGGIDRECCGARLRSGGFCALPVVTGFRRCNRHGGPYQAKAIRARQVEAMSKGLLNPDDFARSERRRDANRLTYVWRRDPWARGSTIDLGEHERLFRLELQEANIPIDHLAPAVQDRSRWRFRRLMLDRSKPGEWSKFLHEIVPELVAQAGLPPLGHLDVGNVVGMPPAFSVDGRLSPWSKRRRLDVPRSAPVPRIASKPVEPVSGDVRAAAAEACWKHHAALSPVFARFAKSDEDKLVLAAGFVRLLASKGSAEGAEEWAALIRRFGA